MSVNKELLDDFTLLCNAIRPTKPDMKVDLSGVEKLIHAEIPEALKKNAPPEYYELYVDFKSEYEKFRDFILYDRLIGKNVVALGGGFSSGKSSFLNALDGERALPEDVDPSTSVPTYIVRGEAHKVFGINIFDAKIEIETREIRKISHGFGKTEDGEGKLVTAGATLGHVLESIFLSTPKQMYENIAFLDTPGYSNPDSEQYSAKTDEHIARGQLNSSNFILWFVQADAGTITEEDVKFIKTLHEDIPKLIILSKADLKPKKELKEIIAKIRSVLELRGVRYEDVLTFSAAGESEEYDIEKIRARLSAWNKGVYESNFAKNFKILFVRCREFYEEELEEERRRLNRLNTSITKLGAENIDRETLEPLELLVKEIRKNADGLKAIQDRLKELQDKFFAEIKRIGDAVGIDMPEPSEIDLLTDKIQDPLRLISAYKNAKGIKTNARSLDLIRESLADIESAFNRAAGGSAYGDELCALIRRGCDVPREEIRFNDVYKNTEQYRQIISDIRRA
jgi:GTP-binding protein EngB required for normal cell division